MFRSLMGYKIQPLYRLDHIEPGETFAIYLNIEQINNFLYSSF